MCILCVCATFSKREREDTEREIGTMHWDKINEQYPVSDPSFLLIPEFLRHSTSKGAEKSSARKDTHTRNAYRDHGIMQFLSLLPSFLPWLRGITSSSPIITIYGVRKL
jgi:hypothetical protein